MHDGSGKADPKGSAGRHRSGEPKPIEPPRFRDELRDDFRTLMLVPLISLALIGWGLGAALNPAGTLSGRSLGIAAVGAGTLFAASLWLYFKPGPLAGEHWRRTASRRRIGFALRHAWSLVVIGAALVLIADWIRG